MKKFLFALAIMPLLIMGCSNDAVDDFDFDYDIKLLQGEWRLTDVEIEGDYIDITNPEVEKDVKPTYITFYSNGSFTLRGVLEGKGTYTTKDKTIMIKNEGGEILKADFESLTGTLAVIYLHIKDFDFGIEIPENMETVKMKLKKQIK